MLVNMGFAGMGYCPRAFVNEPNDNRQGSLFQWVFAVGDAEVSIARATSTLEAYSSLESTFLDKVPALPSNAYHLTGRARHAVAHQFGTLRNAREKIGFCLTALVAIATGRPVLAGLPIDCDPAPCRVHIRRPAAASPLIREGAMGLNHLLIDRLPNPAGWPRGGDALDASSALAVFAQHWGVQAIVVKASVPVVFEEGKMHMRPGILVSFRGTTSFSAKHALHPGNNQPGQHHVVDDGSPEDIADGAAHHQWAMNLRTRLSNVLNGAFGGPDGFRTMDGISHEAALLVGLDVGIAPRHLPEIFEGGDRGVPGNVCDAVRRLSGGARGVPVFVTGHSKGGALSILGSFLLQLCLVKHNSPSRVTTILSVEGPRTGDAAWVRTFTGYMQHTAAELGHARFNVYRTVKRNDPVTEGPLPSSDHRHMPGLLMVPVVTALDVRSDEPTVRLPPVFVCDQTEDLAQIVEWDRSRPQRGRVYKAPLPPHSEWSEHGGECKIQSATRDREVLPANAIEGGRLDGVTCNLCIRGTRDSCVEADYKPSESFLLLTFDARHRRNAERQQLTNCNRCGMR